MTTWKVRTGGFALACGLLFIPSLAFAEGTGFQTTPQGTVYQAADGTTLTGWQQIDGKTYYFDANGMLLIGWQTIDGAVYYFETDGHLVTGAYKIGDAFYLFAADGKRVSGWVESNGVTTYYDDEGKRVSGFQLIAGKRYYFSSDGVRLNGWQTIEGNKHYIFPDGTIRTGMYSIEGKTYLLLERGRLANGWQTVASRHYYFGTDGVRRQGLKQVDGTMYGFHPTYGYRLQGVNTVDGRVYYFGTDGKRRYGLQQIDGTMYGFHPTYGYRLQGMQRIDNRYYYFGTDGKRRYGLQQIDGKTYGFHPTYGYRLQGKQKIGQRTYFFHSSGVRETGWKYTTQYEYFAPMLTKKTDWQVIQSKWYFFDSSGNMFKNKRVANATFDARGVYSPTLSVHRMSVPLYLQFQMGYPSGCEFFSLKMALEEKGKTVSASTLYREMPKSMWNARYENRLYRWVDPNVMFTGDPKGKLSAYRNYGIYPKGMIDFASKYRPVKDLSGQGLASIERELSLGNPVIVWASVDFKRPYGYFSWYTAGNTKYTGFVNYHVMLATGYDKSNLYINDPYRGRLVIPKSQVSAVMGATGWKALAVR